MKTAIFLMALAVTLTVSGQTFCNFQSNPYVMSYSNNQYSIGYTNDLVVSVPTNTLMKIKNVLIPTESIGGEGDGVIVYVTYPASTASLQFCSDYQTYNYEQKQILGPASVRFLGYCETSEVLSDSRFNVLCEFDTVNTQPAPGNFLVQPAAKTASVALETSTNLTTWSATTNGNYDAANSARFFRLNLNVQ